MNMDIRLCTQEDLGILPDFSRRTYFETFAEQNTPENMAAYLDKAFGTEKLRGELENRDSAFYFLYCGGTLAGYLKLNEAPAQTDLHDSHSLEIERIYVAKEFQGKGLGRRLMTYAISAAMQRKKRMSGWECGRKTKRPSPSIERMAFIKSGPTPLSWETTHRPTTSCERISNDEGIFHPRLRWSSHRDGRRGNRHSH